MDNPWATESQDSWHWDATADPEPEPTDPNVASDEWNTAWVNDQVLDQRDKESAVPTELLDSLLRHCQQVSQELWPTSETGDDDSWKSGLDTHADVAALLAQLIPADLTLPSTVQFSTTATAKAMNEALKLTRHLPASASSPLARLLASKGSLEWEKSIKTMQDTVPDTTHVGWRVVEKQDRLTPLDEPKSRKATGGLLSFWNRRASATQPAPVETSTERSSSPARSSQESVKSVPHPLASRAASPSTASTPSVAPPPPTDFHPAVVATAPPPSAVSRFLNRFSRAKGIQHTSLALSSDDLEFLSDIVPSASDPLDEDINDSPLDALTGASNSSPLPPKLPPPIPPPPKQPILSSRPPSALGLGTLDGVSVIGSTPTTFQMQTANHVPVLAPPLSPKPAVSFSRTQSPPLSLKDAATPTVASGLSSTPSIQQRLEPSSRSNSRPHSPFALPPPQKAPASLSIPPLLPPPPVSPPQTPRPGTFPSMAMLGHSSTTWNTDASSFHDSDDEFSAFTSFPPSAPAPFPFSEPYLSQGPPSPPPRRTYERTHYPSSSSTSTLSPTSPSPLDQLCSTRSSISASLDNFDEFVSPPPVGRGGNRKRTPSPPPLPVKPQFEHQPLSRLDTLSSRVYHAHTPSQTFASPTVCTSLMSSAFSVPDVEHQRTQSLVNHAAAQGGILWPNSPDLDGSRVRAIPPPPSSASTSPKPLIGQESFDLLGDGDLSGGLEVLPAPLNAVGDTGMRATVSPPPMGALRAPFGVVGGSGNELGLKNQPQPFASASTPAPILSFASLSNPISLASTNPGPSQPARPKQTGGLSAQDLSFFEGL